MTVRVSPQVDSTPGRRRALLDWSSSTVPVGPLLAAGVLLGPHVLNVLSPRALATVEPAIPVALAALGILIGLGSDSRRPASPWLVSSPLSVIATSVLVAGGLHLVTRILALPVAHPWLLPSMAALCASSSLTFPAALLVESRRHTDRVVTGEVVVTILAGAILLAGRPVPPFQAGVTNLLQGLAVATVMAAAGWLLVVRTTTDAERRVFSVATLLLVGGTADYLSFSSLMGGLAAGLTWRALGGTSREVLQREALYARHPFVAFVLLVAGARTEISPLTAGLAAAYVGLRLGARLASGWLIRRLALPSSPDLGATLVMPGVFGVALALTFLHASDLDTVDASTMLSVVALGTFFSDVVARLTAGREPVA